jgi:hypothetical protein
MQAGRASRSRIAPLNKSCYSSKSERRYFFGGVVHAAIQRGGKYHLICRTRDDYLGV